jgi:hypothetical protein
MSAPSTEDLVLPADRGQQRFLVGVGAGFTALGAAFLYHGGTEGGFAEIGWLAVGAVIAAFGLGATGMLLVRRWADGGGALVLSAQGLTFPGGRFTAWRDIEHVRANPRWVALQLRDDGPMLARQRAWRRKLTRWNARYFGGDVIINTGVLSVQPEDLLRLINERLSGSG